MKKLLKNICIEYLRKKTGITGESFQRILNNERILSTHLKACNWFNKNKDE